MIYLIASFAVQILCVMHVVRTGRPNFWIFIILFGSLIGMLAYFIIEIIPEMRGGRRMRYAKHVAVNAIDPRREVRAAREALETADTVANRTRLADALESSRSYDEAVAEYRSVLAKHGGNDDKVRFKLAKALHGAGKGKEALSELDALSPTHGVGEATKRDLLKAQIFELLGRKAEAIHLYDDVIERDSNLEARCRLSALLVADGEDLQAREHLREVERATRGWDMVQMGDDRAMLEWARGELKRIDG